MTQRNDEPRYVISIAAKLLGIQTHTLRYYEKIGIIEPSRSLGNIRLYSDNDISHLQRVKTLMEDLGVNLAGIEIILRMTQRLSRQQHQIKDLETELKRFRKRKV